jgi:hypothetical protein
MDDRHFNKAINNMLKGTGVTTEHKHHKWAWTEVPSHV